MPNATKQACTCRIDQANKQSLSNTWTIKLNNNTYAIKSYKSKHIFSTISYCGPIQQKSIEWFFMEGAKRHHKCSIRTDLWCITNRLCFTQDNFWCFWYFGTWKKEKILKTINNEYLSFRESSFNMTRGGDEDIEGGLRKFVYFKTNTWHHHTDRMVFNSTI